ncbi:MAG: zinc metallopeptidase [Bacteroidetes bacterium]|nr:MAG: zinc metallopeptidase [Bacteroidota bacterium]
MAYLVLVLIPFIASLIVSMRFRSVARKMSEEGLRNGLSGREIAERLLRDNGLHDVKIISVEGQLTDHYDPRNKTVNLSTEVYHGRSVLAAAVAAHECGHAIQHAKAYSWLEFRSLLAGPVSIASRYMQFIILGGIIALMFNMGPTLLGIGVVLFALTTLFTFITLPVEFDASKRALAWLTSSGLIYQDELEKSRKALNWAASTYVVAALSSLGTLMYYVMMYMGASRED